MPTRARIAAGVEDILERVAVSCAQRPGTTLIALLVVTLLAATAARRLSLSADLIELLPETFESVQQLDRLAESFGAFGFVVVVGKNAEAEQLKAFADELGPKLEVLPDVRYVDYRRPRKFFEDHALYFLDLEDLVKVKDRLGEREAWERRNNNPLYVDLEESEPPSLEFPELQDKYARDDNAMRRNKSEETHYIDTDQRMIALFVKPDGIGADLAFSRTIVNRVKEATSKLDPARFGPDFEVVYGGTFTKKVDQQDLITRDLRKATLAAVGLILLYLGFHFRSAIGIALLFVPLVAGLLWTYGIAAAVFGVLNILTGFIGAILLGLGIDHGIHLLDRFGAERHHHSFETAIRKTFRDTGRAVAVAGLTSMVGFAGLGLSDFRAFSEFGIIAAFGMVGLIVAYLTALPAMLSLAERRGWTPRHFDARRSRFATWLPARARTVALISGIIVVGVAANITNASFNYDTRSLAESQLLSFRLDRQLDALLGYSQTPVIALTNDLQEEKAVAQALRDRKAQNGNESTIDIVMARSDLVPDQQTEKVPVIREMDVIVARVKPKWLEREDRKNLSKLKRMTKADPFTYDDLPKETTQLFEGPGGRREENFVLAFSSLDLSDGFNAVKFSREVRNVPVPGQDKTISAVGEAMVMADVYDMVAREAPPVLGITLVLVTLTMLFLIGDLTKALFALIPALFTVGAVMGVLPLAQMEFNTLNIVMIPVLFGVGVDGGVHIVTRMQETTDIPAVLGETGRAIAAALLTTGLGFGALMLADHSGLNSLGTLALLGLALNLLTCLVVLPAFLAGWRKSGPQAAQPMAKSPLRS